MAPHRRDSTIEMRLWGTPDNVPPPLLPTTGRSVHNDGRGHRHGADKGTRQNMARHRVQDTTLSDDIITRVLGAGSWCIQLAMISCLIDRLSKIV